LSESFSLFIVFGLPAGRFLLELYPMAGCSPAPGLRQQGQPAVNFLPTVASRLKRYKF
jgi:hypothetical protein